jgi:uncharacterized membrane protein
MLLPREMSSEEFSVSKYFIAVAAMIAQGFLAGVVSAAITAVIWSRTRMCSTSCMREVLSKSREVNITLATIAMLCNLLMVLQSYRTKKSFSALLALWMFLPIMLEGSLFLGELESAMEATK